MEPFLEKVLFSAATGFSKPEEQQRFLEFVATSDPGVRQQLEDLLGLEPTAESFFDLQPELGPEGSGTEAVSGGNEGIGGAIGRYRLIERIGEGGCGVVYLAEQQEPVKRKVALKIIRLGMDTENVIARFRAERQALALMDHPNIARVLDAGATGSGRPYFVMELVDGERITDFCTMHGLDLRKRLELFVKVCQAIQHAHQKGVIHRDIKPSNVLVRQHDGVPEPKVIDFGIAKATGGSSGGDVTFTVAGQFVGTPAYMSPEQAEGGVDIDTRSDIYSLGVMLYELVAGRPPFEAKRLTQSGIEETRRILREEEPPPPSVVAGEGRGGDLDWIVIKAMAKERKRRYDTANGLSADVIRVLNDEPVMARPPSRSYRLGKLVRRNKIVFAAGSVAVIALVAGFGVSTRLFFLEKAAREEQARLNRVAEEARVVETGLREAAEFREQVAQAAVQLGRGNIEEADKLLGGIPVARTPVSLEAAESYRKMADWHWAAGRPGPAADRFASIVHARAAVDDSDDNSVSFHIMPAASALCYAGKLGEYDEFREFAIQRFSGTKNPQVAEQLLKASLLRPASPETLQKLQGVASFVESAVNETEGWIGSSPYLASWSCFVLGLKCYREGDFKQATAWLHRSLSYPLDNPSKDTSVRLILAMIDSLEGRKANALLGIQMSQDVIEKNTGGSEVIRDGEGGYWFDWVNAKLLLDEALRSLGP
ncbi:serine/threonine protein kinase [Luteolibacter arcticus]|uniref:Serine/threonine protein kinase n=1 Tax=Luteolibacter arcticus TaxID=1581411 RepID=A0ABT3GQL3_9BACT|nr:serine/threonine-protein kinase [Luteolibacter arcticus]MCW1925802.1 serine/threonine protein kinase [Luteolibacter arcticus]